ncbi:WD40 repeat-like protein [Neoconidiobolus thromboides FSU 785]|nr:WD40 repeat-like protein [Neoconidiobolus thromboides FSU 785]
MVSKKSSEFKSNEEVLNTKQLEDDNELEINQGDLEDEREEAEESGEEMEEEDISEAEEEADEEESSEVETLAKSLKRKNTHSDSEEEYEKDEYEEELEALVFGVKDNEELKSTLDFTNNQLDLENRKQSEVVFDQSGKELFHLDAGVVQEGEEEEDSELSEESEEEETEEKAAWVDDDDEQEVIAIAKEVKLKKYRVTENDVQISGDKLQEKLRETHKKLNNEPTWATTLDTLDDEIMAPFRKVNGVIDTSLSIKRLDSEKLPYERCPDITKSKQLQGSIKFTEFHENGEVVMLAGNKNPISLFRVDGKNNPLIKEINPPIKDYTSAKFINGGQQIIVSSKTTQFYVIDVESGNINSSRLKNEKYRGGFDIATTISPNSNYIAFASTLNSGIHLVNSQTKMLMGTMNLPDGIPKSICFDKNENLLYTLSSTSNVYCWDIRMLRCINKFQDFAGFKASSMSMSPDNNYLCIGSETGIVNLYETKDLNNNNPKPIKEIKNLVTKIDNCTFNHSSQILAISSSDKRDQVKLFDINSKKAFANWPMLNTPISHATSIAFSPNSGYFAVGNQNGRALLFRLHSFPTA